MTRREVVVVGAGPAGLSAAITTARAGADTLLIDENGRPGGQLFKQIHKFFGSKSHWAGSRGIDIGSKLLAEAMTLGVETWLDTVVWGFFRDRTLGVLRAGHSSELQADRIVLATGAAENTLCFPGWTLPGVITAGAAQTMINIHRVLPGHHYLVVGAGNVGLIVAYQLLQAGGQVVAVIDASPKIGGYGVHASKIRRVGVQILTSHTIVKAVGEEQVEGAVITQVDQAMQPIAGTERSLQVDTICLAVGLSPLTELAFMAGCEFRYVPILGGYVPILDECMETSVPGVYAAGDIAGVEEATIAIDEGRLAGLAISASLGYLSVDEATGIMTTTLKQLQELRSAQNCEKKARTIEPQLHAKQNEIVALASPACFANDSTVLQESDCVSITYSGVASTGELSASPGFPSQKRLEKGKVAVVECMQEIPCNPCEIACPYGAIKVGNPITRVPVLIEEACIGCGMCVPSCPGLAIFVVDLAYSDTEATVSFPFEFWPLPEPGDTVKAVNRIGETVTSGRVLQVLNPHSFDRTPVITIIVPKKTAMEVRSIICTRHNIS